MDVPFSGSTQLQTASVHPTSDAATILHPELSGPPQGMPIPVYKQGCTSRANVRH